ncbi:MAG: FKBP-type peptidyl-prolyl cis-trans isomerase [Blastocatellia bacterium]|nr:FKBP-type peptidyl-prolyl cis-trans isomerase [Blastocatellia bacterium]
MRSFFLFLCLLLFTADLTAAQTTAKKPASRRHPRKPAVGKKTVEPPKPALVVSPATTTASGLTYVITKRSNGRKPVKGDLVLVHYTGTLTDGTKFDSSRDRGKPIAFPLGEGRVIKGWDEGIAQLGIGDQAVLVIPSDLGYGDRGAGGVIPPKATLVFVVELVDIQNTSVSQVLSKVLEEKGLEAAVSAFDTLKASGFNNTYMSEDELNTLGYGLMSKGKFKEAIEILKLNVTAYPQSANVYDSLGEAYMRNGEKEQAIASYKKSLQLDPNNKNAVEMLKQLGVTP